MADNIGNIDRYFGGEMGAEEMRQFENIVAQDPILEKEFSFQQELIDGIQAVRKAELKATLSNVDVTGYSALESSALTKILGSVAVAGIVAVGAYFYFDENEVILPAEQISTAELFEQETLSEVTLDEETQEKKSEVIAVIKEENSLPKETVIVTEINENNTNESVVISEANVQEVFDDETEVSETEAPVNHLIAKSKVTHSALEVTVETSKRFSFHYQVKNNSLALYGEFKNLYEIIEFHKDGNITTYLKYDKKYYEIDKQQSKATPLVELTEDQLLNLLDSIENNKER